MSENEEIKTGDVVCLKSHKNITGPGKQKFTVGEIFSGRSYNIHWYNGGELKTAVVHQDALHKIE